MQQKYLPLVTRLGIIYAVLAVAFVAQAALSYSNGQRLKAVYQSQIQAARGLSDLAQDLYALRLKVFQYLGTSKPTEMDAIKTEVAALSSAIAKRLQSDTLGELSPLFATARAQYDSILKEHGDFKTKQAYQTIYGDSQAAFEESKTRITELSSRARAQAEAAEKTAFNTIIGVTIGAAVLVAAALGFLVFYSKRAIVSPLNRLTVYAAKVSQGEMEAPIDGGYQAELHILKESLSQMVVNLRDQISQAAVNEGKARLCADEAIAARSQSEGLKIQAERSFDRMKHAAVQLEQMAETLANASQELSHQIEESAQGANMQKSRASESFDAITQLSQVSLEVARKASTSAQLAERTRTEADKGAQVVDSVVEIILQVHAKAQANKNDMAELGKQAQAISTIIDVINDIADQTNLLALNAAIEAARAGDAGRGFAVVADEVRKLAERTMNATKEVSQAIGNVQDATRRNLAYAEETNSAIANSVERANQSGDALKTIVGLIDETAGQVQSIAAAADEQSATTDHIMEALRHVSSIAEETARSMDESSAAVADLAMTSSRLSELIMEMREQEAAEAIAPTPALVRSAPQERLALPSQVPSPVDGTRAQPTWARDYS